MEQMRKPWLRPCGSSSIQGSHTCLWVKVHCLLLAYLLGQGMWTDDSRKGVLQRSQRFSMWGNIRTRQGPVQKSSKWSLGWIGLVMPLPWKGRTLQVVFLSLSRGTQWEWVWQELLTWIKQNTEAKNVFIKWQICVIRVPRRGAILW